MTKAELISHIADNAGISKVQATAALDSIVGAITKTLKSEGRFAFTGLGTFSVRKRAARKARNPKTGETIKVKAKRVAKFKAGKTLSEKI